MSTATHIAESNPGQTAVLHPSATLATFAANLRFEDIPAAVARRFEDLLLDTMASILAGSKARPVLNMADFAKAMGPAQGLSEDFVRRTHTSPYFAAMVNAASAHFVEQDDVHNGAVFHAAAVVIPPALAVAQAIGASGKDFMTACVAGYEVGIRIGEFLGRPHYKTFHTTGTAGTIAAAAAVGRLLSLTPEQMLNAFGSAGTVTGGLWEFLRDAADSKQLHTGHAASTGLQAAYLAASGFTGAKRILEGKQGLGVAMTTNADPAKLVDGLGSRWALAETSFKFHASCRHTHPAADALQKAMLDNNLSVDDIESVVAHVHQGAIDVLGPVTDPKTVHQSKFSMGTVLGLIAVKNSADLISFDSVLGDGKITEFRERVTMVLDPEIDQAYPARWIGKVTVTTRDGKTVTTVVEEPKGDPGNTLSRPEIEDKAMRLGTYQNAATAQEVKSIIDQVWQIETAAKVGNLLLN
ncbi:MmgE/PrpD family protein [Orrella daihaiensis]|uniref:MmgE/PrpD family protein n=1 Tax=Orrella daihaiensis TaxID=2782176 RepID=A0ABY4AJV0_9BURK|nr:MmgE/PrpD family protein [Orrella daihaiensis]UOD49327.1 MmgE/PrpD family protein [Orrella daihaiensis]